MNARLLAAFLCLTVLGSGCVIVDRDEGPCCSTQPTPTPTPTPRPTPAAPGNITFLWTFANVGAGRCQDVSEVKSIRITIPGETLHNGGIYACNTAGTDGIVLEDFAGGDYPYTLEALDYQGGVLYQASGSVTVNGNVRQQVNLTPKGQGSSFAYVSWTFEANTNSSNPNCTQAGATSVDVRIDGGAWKRLKCEDGLGTNQVSSPYLTPGAHIIEFVGVNVTSSGETAYYYRRGPLNTQANQPISVSYELKAVGGMALRWELLDGSLKKTCDQAGVTGMRINMRDRKTGEYVYGDDGDPQACTAAPIVYTFLPPGEYDVFIRAVNGTQIVYTNESSALTTLTVKAFVQKKPEDATTVNLQRKN